MEKAGFEAEAWSEEWTLPGGEVVRVRPIRPSDAGIEQAFVRGLLPESRYNRFMGQVKELTPAMLDQFTHNHYPDDFALIATVAEDTGAGVACERQVAVVRYCLAPGDKVCEFAVTVDDAWQGRGLGHHLMRVLIDIAQRGGRTRMEGYVLATNHGMLDIARELGFVEKASTEGPQVRLVTLDLKDVLAGVNPA